MICSVTPIFTHIRRIHYTNLPVGKLTFREILLTTATLLPTEIGIIILCIVIYIRLLKIKVNPQRHDLRPYVQKILTC